MNMPSNPPTGRVHQCDKPGVPDPYDSRLDWEMNPERDDLDHRFAMMAIGRILYAFNGIRVYLFDQAWEIAREYLPADKWPVFQKYGRLFSDLEAALQDSTCTVASSVVANLPDRRGTLEWMLKVAMYGAGFCCEETIDQFVSEQIGSDRYDLAQLPGFDLDWLTLAGARKLHDQRTRRLRQSRGLVEDPDLSESVQQETDPGSAGEPLVATMAQENVPGAPVMVLLHLPPDFSRDLLPPVLSLNELETAAFLGGFLEYRPDS